MSDLPEPAAPRPEDVIDDNDRQVVIRRIQRAVAADALNFEELDDRYDAVYGAATRSELEAVAADLPIADGPEPSVPAVGHPVPASNFSVIGDIKVGGWVEVDTDMGYWSVLGDTTVDLSSAKLPEQVVITTGSVLGDTVVIVPDGVRASVEGFQVIGDRKVDLVEPRVGAPTVRVKAHSLIGDVKLYSLSRVPEGRFRKIWRQLRS